MLVGGTGSKLNRLHEGLHSFRIPAMHQIDVRVPSFGKIYEALEEVTSGRTVPYVHAWGSEPILNFGDGDGDILRVILVEAPKFAAGGRFWNAMSVIMKEDSVVLGLLAEGHAKPAQIIVGRI